MFRLPGPLDLRGLHGIADLNREELKYPAFVPTTHPLLAEVESAAPVDVFKAARRHDVLLHHPYDSFATSVQRFIEQAAADPHVLAIKQTLYRTSGDSPDHRRPHRRRRGRQAGAGASSRSRRASTRRPTSAGPASSSRPAATSSTAWSGSRPTASWRMVVRDEPDGIRRYTHIGTGNYNPKTSRIYEDLGLITTDEPIGEDVAHLFNNLSGWSRNASYDELLVAPDSVRTGLVERIHREIEHHQAGRPARIRMKANSRGRRGASSTRSTSPRRPGVPGRSCWSAAICALRPGVPGLSETIEVRSILGRFLEHSRVYWFENGGEPEAWIGSADMMHRNLDRRVEVLVRLPGEDERGARSASCSTWRSTTTPAAWELRQRRRLEPQRRHACTSRRRLIERQRRRRTAHAVTTGPDLRDVGRRTP